MCSEEKLLAQGALPRINNLEFRAGHNAQEFRSLWHIFPGLFNIYNTEENSFAIIDFYLIGKQRAEIPLICVLSVTLL